MRKHHMQAVIERLKTENARLREEHDGILGQIRGKADSHVAGLAGVRDELAAARQEVAGLRGDVAGMSVASVAGVTAAIRDALPKPEPEPEQKPPVPIKRASKTA